MDYHTFETGGLFGDLFFVCIVDCEEWFVYFGKGALARLENSGLLSIHLEGLTSQGL